MTRAYKNDICPECGADSFKTIDYDKMVKERDQISSYYKRMSADHGLARAEWVLQELKLTESMKYLQRKVLKQAKVITAFEEKLKRQGYQPYKELEA